MHLGRIGGDRNDAGVEIHVEDHAEIGVHDPPRLGRVDHARAAAVIRWAEEFARKRLSGIRVCSDVFFMHDRRAVGPLRQFLQRFRTKALEELGVDFLDVCDHRADDGAGLAGRVRGGAHAPEAVQNNAGDGVHHGGEGGHGQDVAGDFDGAFFGGAFDFLEALGIGHRADVPNLVEDGASVADEQSGKLAIVIPSAGDGLFVDFAALLVEVEIDGRNVGLRAVQANVALALLLGIVKGMRVEEGPDELAADVFEAKFEMGVLVDGVMAAVEGGCANVEALLVGDFFRADEAGRIAAARRGNGGIERMSEGIAESDARRGGFD